MLFSMDQNQAGFPVSSWFLHRVATASRSLSLLLSQLVLRSSFIFPPPGSSCPLKTVVKTVPYHRQSLAILKECYQPPAKPLSSELTRTLFQILNRSYCNSFSSPQRLGRWHAMYAVMEGRPQKVPSLVCFIKFLTCYFSHWFNSRVRIHSNSTFKF